MRALYLLAYRRHRHESALLLRVRVRAAACFIPYARGGLLFLLFLLLLLIRLHLTLRWRSEEGLNLFFQCFVFHAN